MKQQQAIALAALTGLLMAAVPAPLVVAQAATASVRLAASRGQVEFLDTGSGHWERLRHPMMASEGTAVRTAPGAELQVTYADGSSMTLGEASAMRFARLRQTGPNGEIGVRLLGQLTASLSPAALASTLTTIDTPVARATFNTAFATARAVRSDVAGELTVARIETPTARAVRLAVNEGAATLQPLYNVAGLVTDTDVAHGSFTLIDSRTGHARRIIVGATTLLATHDSATAHAHRTPDQVVQAVARGTNVIVYGQPVAAEGPGDPNDLRDVNAQVIFPDGADYLSAEEFVTENGGNVTPLVPPVDLGAEITAGHTALVAAGDLLPTILNGIDLVGIDQHLIGPGAGTAGTLAGPAIAGVLIVTAVGIAIVNGNHGGTNNSQPFVPPATTGTLNVVITSRVLNRNIRSRASLNAAADQSVGSVAPLAAPNVMAAAAASFHGGQMGAGFTSSPDGTVVGHLPLNKRLQLYVGASQSNADMFNNMMTVDAGITYSINSTHALGFGVENRNYSIIDPLGNASTMSTFVPQLQYSVRY